MKRIAWHDCDGGTLSNRLTVFALAAYAIFALGVWCGIQWEHVNAPATEEYKAATASERSSLPWESK